MSDWGDEEATPATSSFGGFNGSGGFSDNGDGGFGKPSRGFGGGRGRAKEDTNGDGWGDSSDKPGFPSRGSGFKGRGGFGGRNRDNGDDEDGESGGGFGNRRGGFRGRGGFGGRRHDDNGEDNESGGGFGGERRGGGRGGGFGRSRRDENGDGGFQDEGGDGEVKKRELYIPPADNENEDEMFDKADIGINFEKYQSIPVEVTGRDPPACVSTFEECGFFETTSTNIAKCGYTVPTPVQRYAIPIVSAGRDLMACAQTGSGKTAAFLLPVITKLIRDNVPGASAADYQSPNVLIVSPTRELTLQIYNEARKFLHTTIYRPVVIYGGTSVGHQLRQLENGCNILVATPGRLIDFLGRKKVNLDSLQVLILDEADRMLDMGFEPDIRRVVQEFGMPDKNSRQTLMFSATFPEEIQRLAADFLHDHLFLTVGVVGGTTSDIQQTVIEVDSDGEKREKLQELLLQGGTDRVLVFVETKRTADFLAGLLCQENFPTTSIHGDRFQREREEALRDFRTGRCPVLVATSVAARGLDIPKVKHVINYDLPSSIEEYVHRIGRTGRIGNQGKATGFFISQKDGNLARNLVKVLADAHQDIPNFLEQAATQAVGSSYAAPGGKFASKDIRQFGGGRRSGGFGGDSSGHGNDSGGFGGGFDETPSGGTFNSTAVANEEEW